MVVASLSSSLLVALIVQVASSQGTAYGQSAIDGNYYWETSTTEKYQKYADLTVTTSSNVMTISLDVVWIPGAHVEIGATAPVGNLITQTSGGTTTYTLSFSFEDSFKNKGTGKLVITGTQCALSLTATEVADSRASRQYDDYTLQRQ
jgi:hypothetical protein